jgi:uncharacterized protein
VKQILIILISLFFITSTSQAQKANTLLWRINSPHTSVPSYLYGTMHVGKKEYLNFSDSVYAAINNVSSFYGELDYFKGMTYDFEGSETYFAKKLLFLDSIIKTPGWIRLVNGINKSYDVNIRPDKLEDFLTFSEKANKDVYEVEPGIDIIDISLFKYAQKIGKSIGGLETLKFQMDMMYQIIEARVSDSTIGFEDDTRLNKDLKKYYTTSQIDSMTLLIEKVNISYRKIIFDNRNITMTDSIGNILKTKTAFIAVGCGHLVGTYGILNLLSKKGYTLTPIITAHKIPMATMMMMSDTFKDFFEK